VTVKRLNRYKVIQWLSDIESFVSERNDFIFISFRNFKPVNRFQNKSDVLEFWSLDNSSSKDMRYSMPVGVRSAKTSTTISRVVDSDPYP